jgi:hypothetical protein
MYFKIVFFSLGQFIKKFCSQTMWTFPRAICMFYSLLGVIETLAISQNFVIDPMDFAVCLGRAYYII